MRRLGLSLGIMLTVLPGAASATETLSYTFDALGRLTKVTHGGGPLGGTKVKYTYDPADNRTEVETTGAPTLAPSAVRRTPKASSKPNS